MSSNDENLLNIPDIGPRVAQSIMQSLHNPNFQKEVQDLLSLGVSIEQAARNHDGKLAGKEESSQIAEFPVRVSRTARSTGGPP